MAVVEAKEMYRGRTRQVQYGDVPVYTRIFLVTVDDPDTAFEDIAAEPGSAWLDPHPENENALLVESNVQQDGDSPFHYKVTFSYKSAEDLFDIPWNRPAQFSFSGGLTSAPAFWHYPFPNNNSTKEIIINSAGDAIGGLDRDEGEFTVSISLNLQPPFNYVKAQTYVGAINSDTWSGGAPKTWKCTSITGNRKIEEVAGEKYVYWEVNTTLAYRNTGWDLQTWDVGFNENYFGTRRPIRSSDGEHVSEPAALSNGLAKPPGVPPDLVTFRIYPMRTFTNTFPSLPL